MSSTLLKSNLASPPPMLPPRHKSPTGGGPQDVHGGGPLVWLRERLAGLTTRQAPPLQLEFPDRYVRFRSLREFEFALASRTEFPASRIPDLMNMTPGELEHAATEIREAEHRFSDILTRSVREPALVGEFFRELEIQLFSQDHSWREIMEGLMRLSPTYDTYKRVALVKYMQYLRARQNIMRSVFLEKTRDDDAASVHATRGPDEEPGAATFGDSYLFDLSDDAALSSTGFVSLPKGETVRLNLHGAREMELHLAGNRMRLYTGHPYYIVDAGNNTHPLHAGKNLVGRHSGCDVVVDAACRAVSRHHLIVEPTPDGGVMLTDLSSHGTDVPAALMPQE